MIYWEKDEIKNNFDEYNICDMIVNDEDYCVDNEFNELYEGFEDRSYNRFRD